MGLESMGEHPREMNLGPKEDLLWIVCMHLRIALDFSRAIFSQMPLPVQISKNLWMDSWEWPLRGTWNELGVAFMENAHCPGLEQTAGPQESGSKNYCS